MPDWEAYWRRLDELRAVRQRAQRQAEFERQTLMTQLEKFKLCTCVAMGRYNTCCKGLENVQDGFFHLPNGG